ncbi:MAG: hypothetical protein JSR96_13805 [Proteobacteria bacterium]|nr:hypothetical protein [Pseudomonadota bacterium]
MFRRLLMTLLIACLAVPAMAMPGMNHAAQRASSPMAGSCHEMQRHAPGKAPPVHEQHQCIGCVPAPAPAAQVEGPCEVRGVVALAIQPQPLAGGFRTPETPPPRT